MAHIPLPIEAQGDRAANQAKLAEHDDALNALEAGTGDVTSFATRTGAVVPVGADYAAFYGSKCARKLEVASAAWPTGSDATMYFTTISAALTQAATMTPTSANPIVIVVGPGTYTEDLTLVSNVHVSCGIEQSVLLVGNITWTPGSGVNAAQINTAQTVALTHLQYAANSLTYTSTGTGNCQLYQINCVSGGMACTGRGTIPNGIDNSFNYNCLFAKGTSTYTWTNMTGASSATASQSVGVEIVGCRFVGLTFAGNTIARISGSDQLFKSGSAIVLTDTAAVYCFGLGINNNVTVASGCSFTAPGCVFAATNAVLTVASGGTADVRGSNYNVLTNLAGAGTINRTTWNGTTGSTSIGANTITISPPFPDANYNVSFSQVSGTPTIPTYDTKAGGSFVLHDATGTDVYDYTITHNG